MSAESQMVELSTKLAIELIPKALAGTGIPESITRIVLEALIGAIQEQQTKPDEGLKRLVGSYYQSGTDYLADARRLQGKRREQWIKSALDQFVTASHVEDTLLAAKSQFFVGVCYDLLNESPLARERYERAYTAAYQLSSQAQRRPQELKQLQQFMNSLSQVLLAHGSTLSIAQPLTRGSQPSRATTDQKTQEQWLEEGHTLRNLKQYEEALLAYEQVIRLKPNYAYAYASKGDTLYELKRYEEALSAYEQVIRLKPNDGIAYGYKGIALYELKRYEEALSACEQVIRLDPNNASGYFSKSIVLERLGRKNEAQQFYEKAKQLGVKVL